MLITVCHDIELEEYWPPQTFFNEEEVRAFYSNIVRAHTLHRVHVSSHDFNVMCVGEFDMSTGRLNNYEQPKVLFNLASCYQRCEHCFDEEDN